MDWGGRGYGAPNQGSGKASAGSDSVLTELEPAREQERMDRKGFSRCREKFMQRLRDLRVCGILRKQNYLAHVES